MNLQPNWPGRGDLRRWIYSGLDVLFAVVYIIAIAKVIPNRNLSASIHLWSMPVFTLVLAAGTVFGGRLGWRTGLVAGSALLLSAFLLILRILISAAFLAGVYGGFGKAAASFALVMVAIVVEIVVLLPIVQVKYFMSRAGRRAFGVPLRAEGPPT